jgi:hypothetical protein
MTCPPEIAKVLAEILTTGLLIIRVRGWSGDANRCAIEADHIHNVPDLLVHYSPELLDFYWNVSRSSYIKETPASELAIWEPLWRQLRVSLTSSWRSSK